MGSLKDYQIQSERGVYDKRNKINNLTGKEWLFSTRSVKTKEYSYFYDILPVLSENYIDFMPIELISEIVATFSKSGSIIIDPICNFGSIGLSTCFLTDKREYFGYNYKKIANIRFDKTINLKTINFSQFVFEDKINFSSENKGFILFSELIFSSLNVIQREKEYTEFEKKLKKSIENLISNNLILDYVIIASQNTKGPNLYKNNSKSISCLIKSF